VVVVLVVYLVGVDESGELSNVGSLDRDPGTTLVRRVLAQSSCSILSAGDPEQCCYSDSIRSLPQGCHGSPDIVECRLQQWLVVCQVGITNERLYRSQKIKPRRSRCEFPVFLDEMKSKIWRFTSLLIVSQTSEEGM
jgi:hypothetical protein